MDAWAHIRPDDSPHSLEAHLEKVAALAAHCAERFRADPWAELAGRWHDLGKYRPGFQRKLRLASGIEAHVEGVAGRVTHSTAGAIHAVQKLGAARGRVLGFIIAGHHAGLPDWDPQDGAGSSLMARLASPDGQTEYVEATSQAVPAWILAPPRSLPSVSVDQEGFALWVRMLFSCLVDADFLDTEAYFSPDHASSRARQASLESMKRQFDAAMAQKAAAAGDTPVNRLRASVLDACRRCGANDRLKPGFFSLTVPTGGGKTLSSLAFALEHALRHDRRRIVYAIPYTSIIEQTAQVFRDTLTGLGDTVVLEHHSNLDVREGREDHANRLATENWDAPLIVTTNVQLFESLYAARTSRCRKLHNLADSIIVLDEAQQLPREFLAPVLRVLKHLVRDYGVSVLLCTATQPALHSRHDPFGRVILDGLAEAEIRPIIEDTQPLFDAMRRVRVHLPADMAVPTTWASVAERLVAHDCVLAIVNLRRHARELASMLPTVGTEHLSALMCAEHRSAVIARIRRRLVERLQGRDQAPLRVVSTQLVEAGVDLDFPAVYRALAGLDSIAQAAGRCNREGRMCEPGHVYVFVPEQPAPKGLLQQGVEATKEMAALNQLDDPLAPSTLRRYFDEYYARETGNFDRHGVLELLTPQRAAFRTAAERFRLIDDDGETIIVPWCHDGQPESPINQWLNILAADSSARWARRKLQRYTISVPKRLFEQLLKRGDLVDRAGLWVAEDSRYDPIYGLRMPEDAGDPEGYFI